VPQSKRYSTHEKHATPVTNSVVDDDNDTESPQQLTEKK
jgi:hypothetical protein